MSYATEWQTVRALVQAGFNGEDVAALTSWWTYRVVAIAYFFSSVGQA